MPISFQRESWESFVRDAEAIFPQHWKELALDQAEIPMGMNVDVYAIADKEGRLHVVTAREKSKLIGYLMAWVLPHPHYQDAGLMASTDMFYVLPEYRNGCGARMLMFAAQSLREAGVKKVSISTKVHQDHSAIFEALGWKLTDKVFMRLL